MRGGRCLLQRRFDPAPEQLERSAVGHHHLASEQVEGLDTVRAFVDRVQPVVAIELLDRIVARVAVAAVHLDRQRVAFDAPLRRPALRDRRQDVEQQRGFRALGLAFGGALLVDQACAVQVERQRSFRVGLLRQQHALDVGVLDDRNLRLRWILAAGSDRRLGASASVFERVQIAP
jgi:hypothetical protein